MAIIRGRRLKLWNRTGRSAKPGEDAGLSFQLRMLRAFLLPPAYRDVFVLKEIQGYTLREVTAVLGISRNEVTRNLQRARREMQTG